MARQLLLANDCEIALGDARVLALDCQSTGANPANGHLLEIGWSHPSAPSPTSLIVRLPEGAAIPPRISKLTGIEAAHLLSAVESASAWEALRQVAEDSARALGTETAFVVIHHARFELPFLHALHRRHAPERPFPMEVVCTREIARRLLPELPRCGLRALVGYFGETPPELRRCADHVGATLFVWRQMVDLLESRCGLRTFRQLREWLNQAPPRKGSCVYPMPRETRLSLPDGPGVYRFRRRNGAILYVGKATSLRQRVNSYFRKQTHLPERSLELLTQAHAVEVTPTASALEAAVLETDEIKKHAPPYNVALRVADRQLCFCSADFRASDARPARALPLGPFPSSSMVTAFAACCELLRGAEPTEVLAEQVLGLPPEQAPKAECFKDGLSKFRDKFLSATASGPLEADLIRLGASWWSERLAEIERDRNATEEEDESWSLEPETERVVEWKSADVVRALQGLVMYTARCLRRAEWLCRLSDCSLSFRENGASARMLVLERGVIAKRRDIRAGVRPPVPPGVSRSILARQKCFDVTTYDRLSVLTTELRRLSSEGGALWLRFDRKRVLDTTKIAEALRWI